MASPREDVAQELNDTCRFGALDDGPYCGNPKRITDKKGKTYWDIAFKKFDLIDGTIKVYSDRFILVDYRVKEYNSIKSEKVVFKRVTDAKSFLQGFIR